MRHCLKKLWNQPKEVSQARRQRTRRPGLETLEDRCVPAVFNVNSLSDILNPAPGVVTLRSAIQQANQTPGGNTINLTVAGNYKITLPGTAGESDNAAGEFAILPAGGDLTIQNTSNGAATIDGNHLTRVFDINPNFNPANPTSKFLVTLQGITIQNGMATGATGAGGGIRDVGNASLTLNNVVVTNNSAAGDGGGIVFENTVSTPWTLTVNNSTISNNHAGDAGGGIDTDGSGNVFLNAGTVIANNTSVNQGAGIWLDAVQVGGVFQTANLTVAGTVIRDNSILVAGNVGGGIGNAGNGVVTITGSTVANNYSAGVGGGFGDENAQGTLVVQNSLFQGNTGFGGGGIFVGGPTTTITNSQFQGNISRGHGGGIFATGATLTVVDSTFVGNLAAGSGGGLEIETTGTGTSASAIDFTTITGNRAVNNTNGNIGGGVDLGNGGNFTGTLTLLNDTVNANFAFSGGGVAMAHGGTLNVENTIIAQNQVVNAGPDFVVTNGSVITSLGGNLIGIPYNGVFNKTTDQVGTSANPFDPQLGPLQNNGGPTVGVGALVLQTETPLPGSRAIDKGIALTTSTTDERGFLRVVGTAVDIGAVEFQPGATATTLTSSTATLLQGQSVTLTAQVAPMSAAPNNPVSGTVTFTDGALTLGTVTLDANGMATLTVANLPLGQSTVLASFTPDARAALLVFTSSTSTGLTETVAPANVAPVVTLTDSVATVTTTTNGGTTFTQTVTLTVQVTPPVNSAAPTGTVTIFDGTVALNATPLTVDANGTATLQLTGLPAGTMIGAQSLTAVYTPDTAGAANGFIAATSNTAALTVAATPVAPVVTLTPSVTTITTTTNGGTTFTQTVTLTVQVTPPAGSVTPTGTITIFDGAVALTTTPLTLDANGIATLQLAGLPLGSKLVGGQTLSAVYTPDAGAAVNGYLTATSKTAVLTVGTPGEIVLNQLFEDLLNRPVNAGDLNFWVPQLGDQTNPANPTAQQAVQKVASGILASNEFLTRETTWLFKNYLNRTPNQNDLNFWVPQFQKGLTLEQAATMCVTSPEFISKNGGTSDGTINGIPSQQLITILFQSALGRTPQQKDFTSVAGQTLQQLVNSIFTSPEYHGHTVDVFYQDFLRRTAKNGEATFWTNFYPGGPGASQVPANVQPDVFILSGFIGSQEYIQNAINNPLGEPAIPDNPLQASIK